LVGLRYRGLGFQSRSESIDTTSLLKHQGCTGKVGGEDALSKTDSGSEDAIGEGMGPLAAVLAARIARLEKSFGL
jgi:hypothetical protein